jgi:Na+-transporting methylmalonyl-CoA/oxaloacetate decarboxylase gamma subunit
MQFGDAPTVWGVGLTLAVIAIVLPGILGRRGGYLIGWIYQAALLGLSIFIATINGVGVFYIVLSIIFLSLWIWAMLAGSTIDAARVAWQKANGIDPNNPDGQPEVFRIETDSEEK